MTFNQELVISIMDLSSFLLVTPELLGPRRIRLAKAWWVKSRFGAVRFYLVATVLAAAVGYIAYHSGTELYSNLIHGPMPEQQTVAYSVLMGVGIFFGFAIILWFVAGWPTILMLGLIQFVGERVLVRGFLFWFGVMLFLMGRVLSIWHALA